MKMMKSSYNIRFYSYSSTEHHKLLQMDLVHCGSPMVHQSTLMQLVLMTNTCPIVQQLVVLLEDLDTDQAYLPLDRI